MEEDQQQVHFEALIQPAELEDMNHLSCVSSAFLTFAALKVACLKVKRKSSSLLQKELVSHGISCQSLCSGKHQDLAAKVGFRGHKDG